MPNWIALGQTVRDMYGDGDLPENWDPVFCLSRSLKVIGTDADRSGTCDFLLTFHSNLGPMSYHFHDTARCAENCEFFSIRVSLSSAFRVLSLEFFQRRFGSKKLE